MTVTVAFFLWTDPTYPNSTKWVYGVEHVNLLVRQIDRHLSIPHEFALISDREYEGVDLKVRRVELDTTTFIPSTCYGKLMLFRPDIGDILGKRVFYVDLDTVIVGNLDRVLSRSEDIVLWRHPGWPANPRKAPYNSSFMLLSAGARPQVWNQFPRGKSPGEIREIVGKPGQDQSWIGMTLGPDEATWTAKDGVYGVKSISGALPSNARMVTFPGGRDPSMPEMQKAHQWIAEHRW